MCRVLRNTILLFVVSTGATAELLHGAPFLFRGEPIFARGSFRFGRTPALRAARCALDERIQPDACGFAILCLRAMLAAVDQQDVVGRHAGASELAQPLFDVGWERRSANVEAQLDGRRHFVDVLTAWS